MKGGIDLSPGDVGIQTTVNGRQLPTQLITQPDKRSQWILYFSQDPVVFECVRVCFAGLPRRRGSHWLNIHSLCNVGVAAVE